MTDNDQPNHFRIDIADLSREAGMALVSQFLGPGFNIEAREDGHLDAAADVWPLDGMTASHNERLCARVSRDQNTQPTGFVRVRLITGGRTLGTVDGDDVDLGPGTLAFDGDAAAMNVEFDGFCCLAFKIPADAVGYDPNIHPAFVFLSDDDPEGALIADATRTFFSRIVAADRESADKMVKVITGLVRGFVSSLPTRGGEADLRRRNRLQAMCEYLDENLDKPALGVKDLVREFPASRAAVYRQFSPFGGVNRYLSERRLHRAMRLLTLRSEDFPRIGDVADAIGFADRHHFSRVFRQRFGISPSEARKSLEGQHDLAADGRREAGKLGEHFRKILGRSEGV